jgi:phospholipase/carboxylesterase
MREATWGGLDCIVTGGSDGRGGGDGKLVVLLHGFGAPGDDLVGLAEVLVPPRAAGASAPPRFVFPAAPLDLGWSSRAWWLLDMEKLQRDAALGKPRELSETPPPGLDEARTMVLALLDEVRRELGANPILGGFSQGSMLATEVALRAPVPPAGLVVLSGTFVTPGAWKALMPARASLPIFMSHGKRDPLLPFAHALLARDAWRAAGATVDWVEFDDGHTIPPVVVRGVLAFLAR